jgi:glycine betaine/proline transport system ATP-binding protein
MRDAGLSTIFAVDSHGRLIGIVRAKVASRLMKEGETEGLIEREVQSVKLDTPLNDIMPLFADSTDPVAVVDEENRLKGVIVIGTLLSGLTEGASSE